MRTLRSPSTLTLSLELSELAWLAERAQLAGVPVEEWAVEELLREFEERDTVPSTLVIPLGPQPSPEEPNVTVPCTPEALERLPR